MTPDTPLAQAPYGLPGRSLAFGDVGYPTTPGTPVMRLQDATATSLRIGQLQPVERSLVGCVVLVPQPRHFEPERVGSLPADLGGVVLKAKLGVADARDGGDFAKLVGGHGSALQFVKPGFVPALQPLASRHEVLATLFRVVDAAQAANRAFVVGDQIVALTQIEEPAAILMKGFASAAQIVGIEVHGSVLLVSEFPGIRRPGRGVCEIFGVVISRGGDAEAAAVGEVGFVGFESHDRSSFRSEEADDGEAESGNTENCENDKSESFHLGCSSFGWATSLAVNTTCREFRTFVNGYFHGAGFAL